MKNLQNSIIIPPFEFKILNVEEDMLITKKQKKNMILLNGSTFKRVNEAYESSFCNKDPTIKEVYICSREREGCRCMFLLMNDGNGKLINSHKFSLKHSVDLYRSRRYEFRLHVNECLDNNKTESPFSIINSYLKKTKMDIYTPCLNYMSSTISKVKLAGCGTIPQSFDELDIEKLKEIGEIFEIEILSYSDEGVEKKMILIYSEWQLHLAKSSSFFLGDATYKQISKIFKEMYTIHTLIGPQAFPIFFVLTISKSKKTYKILFERLKELGVNISRYMTDFEKAAREAVKETFPGVTIKGCLFHFYQAIIRNVKNNSLGELYTNNDNVNQFIRLFFGLPFTSISEIGFLLEVIEGQINLINDTVIRGRCQDFFDYFIETWVRGSHFTIEDWNQCADMETLTNNWCEGFHSGFGKRFARSHPNPFSLIDILHKVVIFYQFKHHDILMHRSNYNDDNYSEIAKEIMQIQKDRKNVFKDNHLEYLIALGNPEIRILLKQQYTYFKENKIKYIEMSEIQEMLHGKKELSIIVDESDLVDLKIKHKKLSIITQFLNKKRKKYIDEMTGRNIRIKKRKACDMTLDSVEQKELEDELNSVTEESVQQDQIDRYVHKYNDTIVINENVLNEFNDGNHQDTLSEIQKNNESLIENSNSNNILNNNENDEIENDYHIFNEETNEMDHSKMEEENNNQEELIQDNMEIEQKEEEKRSSPLTPSRIFKHIKNMTPSIGSHFFAKSS